ncbi:flagellar basal-body rod protein FlgG [Bordetella bronchiseptica SBL-F6116]|nr:flagellar basal-body rod protein FlgG [Bordetella bronchiseptica SBL-F6116]
MGCQDGPGRPADVDGRHFQQPGQRPDQRLQAGPRGVPGPDVPDAAPARRAGRDANQLPSGLQLGTGVQVAATQRVFSQGNMNNTGGEMDIAIQGRGFLQVELPDGTQAYTRDGSLQVDQNGQLTTAGGYVIQPPINVPDNALSLTIGKDGTVSVTQPGAAGTNVQIGQLQVATFINPTGLQSVGENLYLETDSSGPANLLQPGIDGAGQILQQYVETSNVNVAEELVNMITTQRAYEMNSKAVKTSDEMLARLTQL